MAIWDLFSKKKIDEAEIDDDFDPAAFSDLFTEKEPAKPLTPEEQLKQRAETRRRNVEAYLDRMYDGLCDCYVLIDQSIPAEELDTAENLRVQITSYNTQNPMPVVHVAVDELSARHMARQFNCMDNGTPLIKKTTFTLFRSMLNDLMRLGIFNVVIHEDDSAVLADSAHVNYYVEGVLLKQDTTAYMHFVQSMQSIHGTRAKKASYYVITNEMPDMEGKYAPTFFGNEERKGLHLPIFAQEEQAKLVEAKMKEQEDARKSRIMEINPIQLVNLLTGLMYNMGQKSFPVQLIDLNGRHPMDASFFARTLILAYNLKRIDQPEQPEQPQTKEPDAQPIRLYDPELDSNYDPAPDGKSED